MVIERQKDSSEGEYILRKLIEFNAEHMPARVPSNHEQLNLIMRQEDGKIVGGILANWVWNWVQVDILWVDAVLRGRGYGSQLLCEIERFALERHCECIQLDTYSFQAPEFYRKHGYEICGHIQYRENVARYYLVKHISYA